jgi:hypothetical protein
VIIASALFTRIVAEAKEICAGISVRVAEEFNILRKIVTSDETSPFQQTEGNADVSTNSVHEITDQKRKGDFQI